MTSSRALIASTDLLAVLDLASHEICTIIELSRIIKRDYLPWREVLSQRAVALLFEKPSLRTRVSFEVGVAKLGGTVVYLDHQTNPIGARDTVGDYGRNLERYCDALVGRVNQHQTLEALAAAARVPVINALSESHHPCQALADFATLFEHGFHPSRGHLAWVGDGNNVCRSLLETAASIGCRMTVVTPPSCAMDDATIQSCLARSCRTGARLEFTSDLHAVAGADAIYTDVWVSMGEKAHEEKSQVLRGYQVNTQLMKHAGAQAMFMHCLPAHRGDEVTDEVMDSSASIVFDQAENRMHVQNALLVALLTPDTARSALTAQNLASSPLTPSLSREHSTP